MRFDLLIWIVFILAALLVANRPSRPVPPPATTTMASLAQRPDCNRTRKPQKRRADWDWIQFRRDSGSPIYRL